MQNKDLLPINWDPSVCTGWLRRWCKALLSFANEKEYSEWLMSLPTVTDMDQPRCVCLEVRISHLHGIFKKYFAGKRKICSSSHSFMFIQIALLRVACFFRVWERRSFSITVTQGSVLCVAVRNQSSMVHKSASSVSVTQSMASDEWKCTALLSSLSLYYALPVCSAMFGHDKRGQNFKNREQKTEHCQRIQ